MKTLNNSTAKHAKDQVKDIEFWGDGDIWKLISKDNKYLTNYKFKFLVAPLAAVLCNVFILFVISSLNFS